MIMINNDNFLYRHFKRKGNTPANILVQPVDKITCDANSTSRFKIINRHETELKWIKLQQTPYPLGFNDKIYHKSYLSKMPDVAGDVFNGVSLCCDDLDEIWDLIESVSEGFPTYF